MVDPAAELGATDDEVHQRTEAVFEVTWQAPRSLVTEGRRGALPSGLDPEAAAESLLTTVLGPRVRERAGHHPARLVTMLQSLGPTPAEAFRPSPA